jgi:hypothetical protein
MGDTMTEQEWLRCTEPQPMLEFLRGKLSERKLRLFACACCRHMDRRGNLSGLAAVELAERVADELMSLSEANLLEQSIRRLFADMWALSHNPFHAARRFAGAMQSWRGLSRLDLLRCIAGNPFHSAVVAPEWLAWCDGAVVRIAQEVYEERAFEQTPILADALEEAGCTDALLLGHLRGGGPHARGCWVVDRLLDKR